MTTENLELIHQARAEDRLLVVREINFAVVVGCPRRAQRLAADTAVLIGFFFVRWPDRNRRARCLMRDTDRGKEMPERLRNVLADGPLRLQRKNDCLARFGVVLHRKHERRALPACHRAAEKAISDTPLFRRLCHGERVLRVQRCITEDRVEVAVIGLRARFGDDINPAAPWT